VAWYGAAGNRTHANSPTHLADHVMLEGVLLRRALLLNMLTNARRSRKELDELVHRQQHL